MAGQKSSRLAPVILASFAALIGGVVVAAVLRHRRRAASPLVIGRDWQALETESIRSAPPVAVRLSSWPGLLDSGEMQGDDAHVPCDAVGSEPPATPSGPYRPVADRGRPTDDSETGE